MRGLVTLDLSGNEIGGTLPPELGKMLNLQYLRLAVSKLEGPIPDTLGEIKGEASGAGHLPFEVIRSNSAISRALYQALLAKLVPQQAQRLDAA
ncbi:unnamed protein product [Ectocarpus sp. CCAP 1310/34]|nr:unnamed protein product [Ectocarpus sp. CCAP 1310/34]